MLTSLFLAFRILTSMPTMTTTAPGRSAVKQAITLFPVVGAMIGAVTGAVWVLAWRLWSGEALVAAAFAMVAELMMTGARGLGGVGRAADALVGMQEHTDRTRALAVLRDPHRNAPGVAAMVVGVVLKTALIAALRPDNAWTCLIVAACLGQWAVAFSFTAFRMLPAWNNADIEESIGDVGPNEFMMSLAVATLGAAILPLRGLLVLAGCAFIVGSIARSVNKIFAGLNVYFGYALGQVGEIVALAILAARW
jgi:cobalamin synthase